MPPSHSDTPSHDGFVCHHNAQLAANVTMASLWKFALETREWPLGKSAAKLCAKCSVLNERPLRRCVTPLVKC